MEINAVHMRTNISVIRRGKATKQQHSLEARLFLDLLESTLRNTGDLVNPPGIFSSRLITIADIGTGPTVE